MKTKRTIVVIGIMLILLLLVPTISKANIEIKPDGIFWGNITISEAYKECQEMTSIGTTLGNQVGLQPHLALNKDWGAVAYLSFSTYGKVRSKTGDKTADEKYYTTTGNMSGVMNWGANPLKSTVYTYTSSIMEDSTTSNPEYRTNLNDNVNSKFVEIIKKDADRNKESSKGMALAETKAWYNSSSSWSTSVYPCFVRYDAICGFLYGVYGGFWGFGRF